MFFDIFNLFLWGFVWFLNSHTTPLNSQWVHRHTGTEGHRQRRESYLRSQEQERASTPGPEAVGGNTQPVPWRRGVVPAAVQVCFHESGEDSNGCETGHVCWPITSFSGHFLGCRTCAFRRKWGRVPCLSLCTKLLWTFVLARILTLLSTPNPNRLIG